MTLGILFSKFFLLLKIFCIVATLRTCLKIKCVPYAGFFLDTVSKRLVMGNYVILPRYTQEAGDPTVRMYILHCKRHDVDK